MKTEEQCLPNSEGVTSNTELYVRVWDKGIVKYSRLQSIFPFHAPCLGKQLEDVFPPNKGVTKKKEKMRNWK